MLALIAILGAETLLLGAATAWLLVELLVDTPESLATAIALTVTVAILTVGVGALTVGTVLGRRGVRGGVLVWQVLQAAVGIGALQGIYARPDLGWALLLPSIVGFVLVLTPAVTAAFGGDQRRDDEDGQTP